MSESSAQLAGHILREARHAVLASWEVGVRDDVPELAMLESRELREHAGDIVQRIVECLDGRAESVASLKAVAEVHAARRYGRGIGVRAMMCEYTRLRACINAALDSLAQHARVDLLIDTMMAHAVQHHVVQHDAQRDRLVGMLAHDLRTPLSCVAMASELLAAPTAWPDSRRLVDQIQAAADRMERMITDALTFARGPERSRQDS